MIFLEFLVDLGLLHFDLKHIKKIEEREKQTGKKMFLEKYLLQPTMIGVYVFSGIVIMIGIFFFIGSNKRDIERTNAEMVEIEITLKNWKGVYQSYPDKLEQIIKGKPLRKNWLTDEWDRNYYYKVAEDGMTFILLSHGPDGILNSSDDISTLGL